MKVTNQSKTSDRDQQSENTKNYTFWSNCWKCGKFGHSVKECQSNSNMATQDQTYEGQTNIQTTEPIRYPTSMSPVRPPVLTQQLQWLSNSCKKLGINLAIKWVKWQKQTDY